jgi:NADH:ubiquinone oxidoreductase subunit 2 (subunit N)
MPSWLHILTLDLAVAGVAGLVLLCDALFAIRGRTLGWLAAAALTGILALSFFVDVEGSAPHAVYVSGPWVLFFKRLFLCTGILGVLGAVDWLEDRVARRQAEYLVLLLFSVVA